MGVDYAGDKKKREEREEKWKLECQKKASDWKRKNLDPLWRKMQELKDRYKALQALQGRLRAGKEKKAKAAIKDQIRKLKEEYEKKKEEQSDVIDKHIDKIKKSFCGENYKEFIPKTDYSKINEPLQYKLESKEEDKAVRKKKKKKKKKKGGAAGAAPRVNGGKYSVKLKF